MLKPSEIARNKWRSLLPALGVKVEFLTGKHGPCPMCGGTDRFRFDDKDGAGTFFCNVCGAGDGFALVMGVNGQSFAQVAASVKGLAGEMPEGRTKPPRDEERCRAAMRDVWNMAVPIAGTMAEDYLRWRGCWSDEVATLHALRFVPGLRAAKHAAGMLPALVARVTGPDGSSVNIHRTFLLDGKNAVVEGKSYRAMMPGPLPAGASIRLGKAAERIGIAEGIETALRASQRFAVPCWSSITAGGMEKWEPPVGVSGVDIFGDADRSYSGQASAFILARKLTNGRNPISCAVHLPEALGTDWADAQAVAA